MDNSYDKIASQFSQTRQHSWKDFEFFRPYLPSPTAQRPSLSILDVGCGNGRLIDFLKPYMKNYYGIDTSGELLKEAEKMHPGYHFEKADMTNFVRPNSFDAIFSIASFHHLSTTDYRLQTLSRWHTSLKPEGFAFLLVWNLWQPKYFWRYIWSYFCGRPRDLFIPWKNQQGEVQTMRYYHSFTRREILSLAKKAGFTIQKFAFIKNGQIQSRRWGSYNMAVVMKKV